MLSALAAAAGLDAPDARLVDAGHALARSCAQADDPAHLAARLEWARAIQGDVPAAEQACVLAVAALRAQPPAVDDLVDGEDGPTGVAELLAVAATVPAARADARAVLASYPGLLVRSPLACCGPLLALDRLEG